MTFCFTLCDFLQKQSGFTSRRLVNGRLHCSGGAVRAHLGDQDRRAVVEGGGALALRIRIAQVRVHWVDVARGGRDLGGR